MRNEGVTNISLDLSKNKLVIEFGNSNSRTLDDSNLTPEQVQLKDFFRNNPAKPNISRSELEQELVNSSTNPGDSNGDSKAGIIAVLVVAALIVAVIVGFVVGQKKKKNY